MGRQILGVDFSKWVKYKIQNFCLAVMNYIFKCVYIKNYMSFANKMTDI